MGMFAKRYRLARLLMCVVLWPLGGAHASTALPVIDSRAYMERSVALIGEGNHELARTYLAPVLIDFRLRAGERARAYYLRGYSFYAQKLYVSAGKDYVRALEFNPDNPAVLAAMAGLQALGLGVQRDEALAFRLFSKAAHAGHVDAQFHVGYAELEGRGTTKNLDSARGWLKGAAEQGHVPAMTHMARSFRKDITDSPDPELAKTWYEKAHAAGAVDALVSLAFMYQGDEFGAPNAERAAELFGEAANAGSGAGQVSLGHLYLTGESIPRDYAKALSLFEQAAAQQNPASYLWLGHLSEAGLGVDTDLDAAEDWYRRGAQTGLLPAQLRLVRLLLGRDTATARTEAMGWLARAAEHDDPRAHNDYAWMLATHPQSSLRDGELAVSLARRAVASDPTAAYLDTLAAAYAEAGQFAEAISTQREALTLLDETQLDLRAELNTHLYAYEEGKPWRQ